MAAAFLIAGSICLLLGGRAMVEEWRFARHGVSTDGTVVAKEHERYRATYRFMVPEGVFESRARLSYDDWARLEERQAVEVLYLPDRPATNRLAGSGQWIGPAVVSLLGSVFLAASLTLARSSRSPARRR